MKFDNILVTSDLSEASIPALEVAAEEAKNSDSKIHLVHIIDVDSGLGEGRLAQYQEMFKEWFEENKALADKELDEVIAKYFPGLDVKKVILRRKKSVSEEIVQYADKEKCDAILIASRGRGSIGSFFLGSTTQRLLQFAKCPVIVIPPGVENNSSQ